MLEISTTSYDALTPDLERLGMEVVGDLKIAAEKAAAHLAY